MISSPALGTRIGARRPAPPRARRAASSRHGLPVADAMPRLLERTAAGAGIRWRCLSSGEGGEGPSILLLHGTGSSAHSWAGVASRLSRRFSVLAPDLPGHGGTGMLPAGRAALPDFAEAVVELVVRLDAWPAIIVGHSAGAAIAARISLDAESGRHGRRSVPAVVGVNGAWLPFAGWAAATFAPLARLLALNPFVPALVSWAAADPRAVRRLLDATGSRADDEAVAHYTGLLRSPTHVAGTLRMLTQWDLHGLLPELPKLGARLSLVVGDADRTVPPEVSAKVHALVPGSRIRALPGLGHLAHEESPDVVARIVEAVALERGLLREELPAGGSTR